MESGTLKQNFFDHLQGDLESSLEKLNKSNEESWITYIDDNMGGKQPNLSSNRVNPRRTFL